MNFNRIVFIFFIVSSLNAQTNLPSYKRVDLPVCTSQSDTKLLNPGQSYFPINFFAGAVKNSKSYTYSDWPPYSPRHESFADNLRNSHTFTCLQKLIDDGIFTGIIFYNNYWKPWLLRFQKKMIEQYRLEYYIQAYQKTNGKGHRPDRIRSFHSAFNSNSKVNFYFMDDFFPDNWTKKELVEFSDDLKRIAPQKKQLACPGIWHTDILSEIIFDKIDIYAPQNYVTSGKLPLGSNLYEKIPELGKGERYHFLNLMASDHVILHNKKNFDNLKFWVTLPSYHFNVKEYGKTVHRFPTLKEHRYFFYDAIICGAKGIAYFALYESSKQSYDSIKKVVTEFLISGFEQAVLNGNYHPQIIDDSNLRINRDLSDKYGKKINDIDFTVYDYNGIYFCIFTNVSEIPLSKKIKINSKAIAKVEEIWFDKKMFVKELNSRDSYFQLSIKPFEIKLIKIYKKT